MRFANVSIVPVTAHHGIHESIFSTQSPVEYDLEVPGSVLNARLTRSTTMDTWLPVLACVCRDDIGPGEFVIAGPDSSSEEQESQQQQDLQGGSWVATGVGDPEKLDISRLQDVEISNELIALVWQQCHQAVAKYIPK
jgi:hypothetical protein